MAALWVLQGGGTGCRRLPDPTETTDGGVFSSVPRVRHTGPHTLTDTQRDRVVEASTGEQSRVERPAGASDVFHTDIKRLWHDANQESGGQKMLNTNTVEAYMQLIKRRWDAAGIQDWRRFTVVSVWFWPYLQQKNSDRLARTLGRAFRSAPSVLLFPIVHCGQCPVDRRASTTLIRLLR